MNTNHVIDRSPDAWLRRAIELTLQVQATSVISGRPWEPGPPMLRRPSSLSYQHPVRPNYHPYPELCLALEGEAVFEIGDRLHQFEPPYLAVVEPGMKHCEGFRRRRSSYAMLWLWPGMSATVGTVSIYTPQRRWGFAVYFSLRSARVEGLFKRFFGKDPWMRPQWLEQVRADLLAVLGDLNRQEVYRAEASGKGSDDHRRQVMLEEVRDLLDQHLHQGITVGELARAVHLTPNYLNRIFAQWSGESVYAYLTRRRMEEAMKLCRQSDLLLKEIAWRVGYHDPLYFSRAFRRFHGIPPTGARESKW